MANAQTPTYSGRSIITSRLKGLGTEPKNIGWGIGVVTQSANSDVNLFQPATESRVAGASTLITTAQLADTYQVVGSITCLGSSKNITEAGLFDQITNGPTTSLLAAVATASATVFSLGATVGPASGNFYAQIGNEVILVTGGQNTAVLTGVRAQLGSAAGASYASGTPFTPGGDGGAFANGTLGGATANWAAANLGGNMFAHADFAGVAVNVNDSINFTFKDQFN
jgi:hypothetical protein